MSPALAMNTDARADLLADIAPEARERLQQMHVLVGGLGNIGSWLASMLSTVVGSIVLIDRDRIDLARNRWNQWYSDTADDGRYKTEVIAEQLQHNAPWLKVKTWTGDLEQAPLGLFAEVDCVFGALDSLRARQCLINERDRKSVV